MKITFIILHYQNIEDTINCIDSIKKLETTNKQEIEIIVVDNKSPNNTGTDLKEKYSNDKKVKVILLDKNYGFSRANNIAYKVAIEQKPDVICVSNNDIIMENKSFITELEKTCNKGYDIICPDIINLEKQHQNPIRNDEMNLKKAYKNMIYQSVYSFIMHIVGVRKVIKDKMEKREKKWMKDYYSEKKNEKTEQYFVPFGAFIIYTNNWIKNEEKAFTSDTFMYMEEDMLALYIKKKEYRIIYEPKLQVKHLEGQSTKKSTKNEYKKAIFTSKNKAKALRKYIQYYKKIKKEEK